MTNTECKNFISHTLKSHQGLQVGGLATLPRNPRDWHKDSKVQVAWNNLEDFNYLYDPVQEPEAFYVQPPSLHLNALVGATARGFQTEEGFFLILTDAKDESFLGWSAECWGA